MTGGESGVVDRIIVMRNVDRNPRASLTANAVCASIAFAMVSVVPASCCELCASVVGYYRGVSSFSSRIVMAPRDALSARYVRVCRRRSYRAS